MDDDRRYPDEPVVVSGPLMFRPLRVGESHKTYSSLLV